MNKTVQQKILIVDDMPVNLELMKSILSREDYLIVTSKTGNSAMAKANANVFDLILLDIVLPDIDGFEICRQIKAGSKNKETPIIFLTAQREKESIVKGFKLGAVDYILKPFSDEELLARVKLHLSLKKTQQELLLARNEAEGLAKAKSMFLANMSHEIRTPLNGIVGMVDILKQTALDEQQTEFVEIVDISSENLLMIINDILDYSKIEAGQIAFEKIKFNLKQEVEEVKKLLYYKSSQKNLEFSIVYDDDLPDMLIGDPLRLKQILINLSNNAIKFTREGFVRVFVKLDKKYGQKYRLLFEVEDSGIGISPENQSKLFRSFSQADSSTTRKYGGTGLGLAISKKLSNLMSGEIGVISEENKGSKFWFTAVFDDAGIMDAKIDEDIIVESNEVDEEYVKIPRQLKILLVEDNVINQKVSLLTVKRLGHEVTLADNGIKAVEFYNRLSFDLILMDILMPVMDGVEATKEIRKIENEKGEEKKIPIIAMTANLFKEDVEYFLKSGMNDHLGKPFKPSDLELVIQRNLI
ncbi:response regulator [Sunxiuqinia sp. A32]|uniref:response regulator n=1 Tax=Sunxiuqinia sp. A32 TaxID=3461496 RepID=UPI004045E271